ncbi:MAG: polysaccharide deacetylase family protein [Parvularculaceae bacterium]
MTIASIPVLTYHSISDEPGPTSIPLSVFSEQMKAIADSGVTVLDLDQFLAWRKGELEISQPSVAITFDDAFRDYADAAYPVMARLGFPSCVFAPSAVLGSSENWYGANERRRPLMDLATVKELSDGLASFGSHTRTHADLTKISGDTLIAEIADSKHELEDRLGKPVRHFAPPYGHSNKAARDEIARHYASSFGVRLGKADRNAPIFDFPRIEMHYYRDLPRWWEFLTGRGGAYFEIRRAARGVREAAEKALRPSAR